MKTILLTTALLFSFSNAWACLDPTVSGKEKLVNCSVMAQQGNASAQNMLGHMYSNGIGVPQDYKQALKWYRRAAKQGHTKAQYSLGYMYKYGKGVAQNDIQTYMWWSIAGDSGHSGAINNRDVVAKEMTPSQIQEAQRLAREWTKKH